MDRTQSTTDAEPSADHPYASQLAEAGYALHPLAALFPPMQEDEFLALCESIRLHGQREPVLVWNGRILDGAHRTRACLRLGITPETEQFKGTADDAQAMVLDLNLHRRHLSTSQRALIAAGLATRGMGRPSTNGEKSSNSTTLTQAEAAALLNVGETTLREATRLTMEADDDLVENVRSGSWSINAASREHEYREQQKAWEAGREERERAAEERRRKWEEEKKEREAEMKEEKEVQWPPCPEGWTSEPRWGDDLLWKREWLINGQRAELTITCWAPESPARWAIEAERYGTQSQPYDRLATPLEALADLQDHLPGL